MRLARATPRKIAAGSPLPQGERRWVRLRLFSCGEDDRPQAIEHVVPALRRDQALPVAAVRQGSLPAREGLPWRCARLLGPASRLARRARGGKAAPGKFRAARMRAGHACRGESLSCLARDGGSAFSRRAGGSRRGSHAPRSDAPHPRAVPDAGSGIAARAPGRPRRQRRSLSWEGEVSEEENCAQAARSALAPNYRCVTCATRLVTGSSWRNASMRLRSFWKEASWRPVSCSPRGTWMVIGLTNLLLTRIS